MEDSPPLFQRKTRVEDTLTEEEERWLEAIESGNIDEIIDEELKLIKDPKLFTARQKALMTASTQEELLSLPSTRLVTKVVTEEDREKANQKKIEQKKLADERKENIRKKTVERLLKKSTSDTKTVKSTNATAVTVNRVAGTSVRSVSRFIQNRDSLSLSFPEDCPLKAYVFPGVSKIDF